MGMYAGDEEMTQDETDWRPPDDPAFNPEPPDEESEYHTTIEIRCGCCHHVEIFVDRQEAKDQGWVTTNSYNLVCEVCAGELAQLKDSER